MTKNKFGPRREAPSSSANALLLPRMNASPVAWGANLGLDFGHVGAVHEPPLHTPQMTTSHWYDHLPRRCDTNVGGGSRTAPWTLDIPCHKWTFPPAPQPGAAHHPREPPGVARHTIPVPARYLLGFVSLCEITLQEVVPGRLSRIHQGRSRCSVFNLRQAIALARHHYRYKANKWRKLTLPQGS